MPASAAANDAALEAFAFNLAQTDNTEPLTLDLVPTLPTSETEEPDRHAMMTRATAPRSLAAGVDCWRARWRPPSRPRNRPSRFPTQDDAIVEHLPTHVGDAAERRAARAAERAQRTALQQHPDELGLALQAAHDALARGRLRGDPRELGVAQAALAPWWSRADAPPEVRLVRATVLQSQHEFQAALGRARRRARDARRRRCPCARRPS